MRIRARWYADGELCDIVSRDGRFEIVGPPDPSATPDRRADWAAPGLFDLQINGGEGRSFNSPQLTIDGIRHVVELCRRHGVAAFCPTLVTQSAEALLHAFAVLRRACETDADIARAVPALHLEGPYISPEDGPRGAHPRRHVRPPDWDEFRRFQDAAGGRIRVVTLAPEHDGALGFIEKAAASGVVVALGHTAASGQRIRDAVKAGARLSTHLGNGCSAILPRHENPIWEQLAEDGLWASVICDGWHLTPAVARCVLRVKTPARAVLTCDASSLAGLPPGRYREWNEEFEVLPSGKVVVPGTTYLAGSGVFTDACIGWAVRHAGVNLHDAVDMAGARPRELLGLAEGLSDLVLFEQGAESAFRVAATIAA
ncbi:MAG TPA: N-acetylglucosamine-6-phosphate deacetylase [Gemmataceae bacterium]|nr:N-acetylglucosamine-6-phosphate deacetylase [Gemmataceae bacterium]